MAFLAVLLSLSFVVGPIVLAAREVGARVDGRRGLPVYALLGVLWLVGAGYPVIKVLFPGAVLGRATLTKGTRAIVDLPEPGPFELEVSGELHQGGGDLLAAYAFRATGDGGSHGEVSGTFQRTVSQVRMGRRGSGTSISNQTQNRHHLDVAGKRLTFEVTQLDAAIADRLDVIVRPAPLPLAPFFAVLGVVVLAAVVSDVRLSRGHRPPHLALLAGFTAIFAYNYPALATSSRLVESAVGAGLLGGFIGALGGALASWIARKALNKTPPKAAKASRR